MGRPRGQIAAWIGVAICVFGLASLGGLLAHVPSLAGATLQRDAAMAMSGAVAMILAGLALVAAALLPQRGWLAGGLALVLGGLGGIGLAENLADLNLGLDLPRLHYWLGGPVLRAGRMAPAIALGCVLAAAAILTLFAAPRARLAHAILAALVALVGLTGLLAYGLHLEAVFPFHGMPAMAPFAGVALMAEAAGITLLAGAGDWRETWLQWAPSHRILTIAAIVLVLVMAGAGISSLILLQHMSQRDATTDLALRRDERTHYVAMLVADALARGRDFANRPELSARLRAQAGQRTRLPTLPLAFRSLQLHSADGALVASLGPAPVVPQLGLTLPEPASAQLTWHDGFFLQQRVRLARGNRTLGTVELEQPLPLLASIGIETASWGATGEMGLCGISPASRQVLECYPQRMLPQPYQLSVRLQGHERPMTLAIRGQTGVEMATDYRGRRVLAAFGPVPGTGLGLVVKMDSSELYAFTRRQLEIMLPLIAVLIVAGLLLLHWEVQPLVQQLVHSRNEAQRSEARFRAAAGSSLDPFFIFETERDSRSELILDFRLAYANDNALRFAADAEIGERVGAMTRLAASDFFQAFVRVVTSRRAQEDELALAGEPGIWLHRQIVPLGDGVAMTIHDISERKRAETQLLQLAQRDPLTGLVNRRTFLAQLEHAMAASRRLHHQALLAVLFLDLDHFKAVNDAWGHVQGDRLLQTVADRLTACVRSADTVARMGGDEFTLLLENLEGPDDAERVIACIFRALEVPVALSGGSVTTGASIGLAYYRGEDLIAQDLVARADAALYAAKRSGRNDFRVFAA